MVERVNLYPPRPPPPPPPSRFCGASLVGTGGLRMADRAVGNAARVDMQANAHRRHLGEAREKLLIGLLIGLFNGVSTVSNAEEVSNG